jgi:hypothetical protein
VQILDVEGQHQRELLGEQQDRKQPRALPDLRTISMAAKITIGQV